MRNEELKYESIVEHIVNEIPALDSLYAEHVENYDEVLQHVFFGDLTRYVSRKFQLRSTPSVPNQDSTNELDKIMDFFERAMSSSDPRVQELVSVSFLENLDPQDEAYPDIRSALGPRLKKELEHYK